MATAKRSSGNGKKTGISKPSPSSAVSDHSLVKGTPQAIRDWLTLLPEDSLVSHTPLPANVRERWTKEICGRKPVAFLERSSQGSLFWKTCQGSLWENDPTSGEFCETCPTSGLMLAGACYRLRNLGQDICESGSGLWPTPASRDWKSGQASEATLNKNSRPLNEIVEMIPTPRSTDGSKGGPNQRGSKGDLMLPSFVAQFPTPNVADALGGPGNQGRDGGENLRTVVGGRLNPDWVEWLMGWPIGWTRLDPLAELVTHDISIEPNILRTTKEKTSRVSRLKALGNGWVPQCAVRAFQFLAWGMG